MNYLFIILYSTAIIVVQYELTTWILDSFVVPVIMIRVVQPLEIVAMREATTI